MHLKEETDVIEKDICNTMNVSVSADVHVELYAKNERTDDGIARQN